MKKILFVSSEAVPYVKTGGLADVVGSLPKYFDKKEYDVRVVIPKYACMDRSFLPNLKFLCHFYVNLNWRRQYVGIFESEYHGVHFYFVDNEFYFAGESPYNNIYEDVEKFAYFSRAVLASLPYIDFAPDIIHCNDWQTGLIPVFLHTVFGDDNFYAGIKTVFTIHNLQFQGRWRIQEIMDITGLPAHIFNAYELESYGEANYLKGGVVYADYITTVSPTYANEITTVEGGEGLSGLMTARKDRLYGILNGIDYEEYILEITAQDANLKNMGLEKAVQTILAVRFGNVKCVDKADITGIINTIRQVRSYALKKARGLKKLVVCLI